MSGNDHDFTAASAFSRLVEAINTGVTDPAKHIRPTAEQQAVIQFGQSPLLVVAGAGSGKTETMAQRITYAVLTWGIRPEQVLGLTFTRKAAAQIDTKVNGMLRNARLNFGLGVTAKTYNSFAQQLVREFGLLIGVDPEAKLINETTKKMLLLQLLEEAQPPLPTTNSVDSYLEAVMQILSTAGTHLEELASVEKLLAREQFAALIMQQNAKTTVKKMSAEASERIPLTLRLFEIARKYQQYKRAHGLIDFSDQDLYGAQLACLPHVQEAIRARYKMIVLDEFQDTSETQLLMLSQLFRDQAVTAVGDPLQAIYEWRGASAAALAGFRSQFQSAGQAPILNLGVSWRNAEAVLAVANKLITPWLKEDKTCHSSPIPGGIRPVKLRHRSYAHLASDEVPEITELPASQRVQIQLVAAAAEIPQKTAELVKKLRRSGKTTAVLVRKRKEIASHLAALRNAGIPAVAAGLNGLLDEPAVADVIAVLRVLADPNYGPALMRLLNNQGVAPADMRVLWEHARALGKAAEESRSETNSAATPALSIPNLRDAIAHPPAAAFTPDSLTPSAQARVLNLDARLRLLEAKAHLPLQELVQLIIQVFDIDIDLENSADAAIQRACLEEFQEYVRSFVLTDPVATVDRFLSWIDNAQDEDGLKQPEVTTDLQNTVQVLTIHASKGLEWDLVICPSFSAGTLPSLNNPRPWYRKIGGIPPQLVTSAPGQDTESLWELVRPEIARIDPPTCFQELADLEELPVLTKQSQETIEHKLQEAASAAIEKEHNSELRLAYVACTRAKDELVILGAPRLNRRGKETKIEISAFFSAILGTPAGAISFADATAGMQVAEIEQYNDAIAEDVVSAVWPPAVSRQRQQLLTGAKHIEQLMQSDTIVLPHAQTAAPQFTSPAIGTWFARQEQGIELLLAARAQKQRQYELPLAGTLAVTRVERLLQNPQQYALDERRPIPRKPNLGLTYGEQFHQVMQTLLLEGRTAALEQGKTLGDATTGTQISPEFRASLEHAVETVAGLKLLQNREVVAVESDYVSSGRPRLVARVDALLREKESGNLVVIDWKSGQPRPEYRDQVMLYRAVVAEVFQLPVQQVSAYLVYATKPQAPLDNVSAQLDPDGSQDIEYWRNRIHNATREN